MTDQNTNAWVESQFADGDASAQPCGPTNADQPREAALPDPAIVPPRPQAVPRPAMSVRQTIADLMRGGRPAPTPAPPQPPVTRPAPPEPVVEELEELDVAPVAEAVAELYEPAETALVDPGPQPEPEPECEPLLEQAEATPELVEATDAVPPPVASGDGGLPDLDRYFPWLRDRKPAEEAPAEAMPEPVEAEATMAVPTLEDTPVTSAEPQTAALEVTEPEPEPAIPVPPVPLAASAPEPPQATVHPQFASRSTGKGRPAPEPQPQPRLRPVAPPLTAEHFWALRPQPIARFVAVGSPRPVEAAQACRDRLDQIGRLLGGGSVSPSERAASGIKPDSRAAGCTIQETQGDGAGTLRAALEFVGAGGRRSED